MSVDWNLEWSCWGLGVIGGKDGLVILLGPFSVEVHW